MKVDTCFKLLGNYINFFVGEEEKIGQLIQIRYDFNGNLLIGIDEDGYIEEYKMSEVKIVTKFHRQGSLTRQIITWVNRNINSFNYDLAKYYSSKINDILEIVEDETIKNQIISALDVGNRIEKLTSLYDDVDNLLLNDEDSELLRGIIAYKQHDRDIAYKIFGERWIKEKHNLDCCRDFILVADEFDNDAACFYLLNKFFSINSQDFNGGYFENLWWKYLYYAVKYNNFDLMEQISITEQNVRILLDSFIYIFHMYNLKHIAESLTECFMDGENIILQQNNADLGNVNSTIDRLNLYKNYLPDTAEGYYLRFESCMNKIVQEHEKRNSYILDDERSGYIYEYVKSRNYGFIIGYDFQKYFYHREDLNKNIQKKIMDNMYSYKDINEEDKIYVQFRRESINKKIQAMDII